MTLINPSAAAVLDINAFPTANIPVVTLPLSGAELMILMQNGNNAYLAVSNFGQYLTTLTVPSLLAVSAGTQSGALSGLTFANSNGVSFGLSNGVITASAVGGGGGAITFSAGASSGSLNSLVFGDSNGISWGLNGSTLTATYTVPGTSLFSNSNNVTFGLAGSTWTASASFNQSVQTQNLIRAIAVPGTTVGNGTVVFSNSNNVSWTLNGSTLNASASFAQSNQQLTLFATNNTTQSSSGLINASSLIFNGAGNVSIGISNGSVVISGGTAAAAPLLVSAGTTNSNVTQLVFGNANNVSFGMNGATITATATFNQSVQAGSITVTGNTAANSTGTYAAGLIVNASTNITAWMSNGSLVLSAGAGGGGGTAASLFALGNTTQSSSTVLGLSQLSFNALGGMSWGYSNGSIQVSAPATSSLSATGIVSISSNGSTISIGASQSNQQMTIYATGNTTQSSSGTRNASSVVFNGAGNVSVGISNGSVVVSGAQSVQAGTITITGNTAANSTGTWASGLIVNASTNITAWMSNGSLVLSGNSGGGGGGTASLFALGNTTQNSSTALNIASLSYNALGAMSWGYSNGSIQVSAPALSSLSATGLLSISTNGSTISIGAGPAAVFLAGNTTNSSSGTIDLRSVYFKATGAVTVGYSAGSILISV